MLSNMPAAGFSPKSSGVNQIATICLLTYGDHLEYYQRCLTSILATTPHDQIQLRLGFNASPKALAWTREILQPRAEFHTTLQVRGKVVTQVSFLTPANLSVTLFVAEDNVCKWPMAHLMYHYPRLATEYAVWFDDDSFVEAGWWEALLPLMRKKIDYIGKLYVLPVFRGQDEMFQAMPWYRGRPFIIHEGRPSAVFITGGVLTVRSERLQQCNWPDLNFSFRGEKLNHNGGDVLLGQIAHQLGWTRANHHQLMHINVDMNDVHPAPRRGVSEKVFGCLDQVVVM